MPRDVRITTSSAGIEGSKQRVKTREGYSRYKIYFLRLAFTPNCDRIDIGGS